MNEVAHEVLEGLRINMEIEFTPEDASSSINDVRRELAIQTAKKSVGAMGEADGVSIEASYGVLTDNEYAIEAAEAGLVGPTEGADRSGSTDEDVNNAVEPAYVPIYQDTPAWLVRFTGVQFQFHAPRGETPEITNEFIVFVDASGVKVLERVSFR